MTDLSQGKGEEDENSGATIAVTCDSDVVL
jgi:hypothetical protein